LCLAHPSRANSAGPDCCPTTGCTFLECCDTSDGLPPSTRRCLRVSCRARVQASTELASVSSPSPVHSSQSTQ
jgi:hypothetical protein